MSRIVPLPESEMSHQARMVIHEIRCTLGRVSNMFLAYAHYPPLLRANWNKVQAVMMEGCFVDSLQVDLDTESPVDGAVLRVRNQ